MTELSNEDDLNVTPKLPEDKNNRFSKSPIIMPTLSKMIKRKVNNNLMKKSQKIQRDKEQLYLDYHRNSINNVNNYRTNLPNIITSLTPIEKRNYKRISVAPKNKSNQNIKNTYISRNFDSSVLNYHNSDNVYFFENDQLNNTFHLKRFNKIKNNKYNDIDNDMSLSQIISNKNKNNIYLGNNNIYSRNIENISNKNNLNSNYLTQNNISSTTKNNNYNNKLKFSLNKKNLMNTIKKPSKINLEKKNLKYKIPIDMINNYNYGKTGNNRKLNIKQRSNKSANKEIIDCSNIDNQNNEKEEINNNNSKEFIKSTLIAFNGLVSQAQELGQILIDNKEMINSNSRNDSNSNKLKNSINNVNINNMNNIDDMNDLNDINDLNVKLKLNKLNQEIKNEHKTVEELQKINSDLNNKINLFNENTQQYENKVKELVTVINQIKNTNNNNASNSNSNSDNYSNGLGNNNILRKDSSNKFMLENKPKKKKMKFGFVETIFMKDDKFEVILKKPPPKYDIANKEYLTINKNEPKLKFVNVNKNENGENKEKDKNKVTEEEYLDAASQMANQLIIESLLLLENEEED